MIARSAGIVVPGWFGPRPSGGVTGATEELDRMVAEAASLLEEEFGEDVEIRFNADRMSGGAYLKDESRGALGISVRYEFKSAGDQERELGCNVYAGVRRLRDKALAEWGSFGEEYALVPVSDPRATIEWVRDHTLRAPEPRVPPRTLAAWKKRLVRSGSDPSLASTFNECVGVAGRHAEYAGLGERETAAWFREEYGVPEKDAEDVAAAVHGLLIPGRRSRGKV